MKTVGKAQTLNAASQRMILDLIKQRSRYVERDIAIFCLSFYAGLRVGEIAALTVGDVLQFEDASSEFEVKSVVTLTKTKGQKAREAFLAHPKLRLAIAQHVETNLSTILKANSSSSSRKLPLFTTRSGKPFSSTMLNQVFRRFYDWGGLNNAKSHSGRRTFITSLAEKGFNLRHLQVLAGHASVQTTAGYVDANPQILTKIAEQSMDGSIAKALT